MGEVVNIRRCKCGAAGSRIEADFRGENIGHFVACQSCLGNTIALLDRVRPVFDAMIAAGVEHEHANDTMTFLLEKM